MVDQNSTFGGFLTDVGEAKQANANALSTPWKLTHMLLGDANGSDPVPDAKQTSLINQVYRAPVNQLSVDPDNPGILIAELVLPPNVGGWWIRELGLEDADGDFVAVANCAPSYKPLLAQGSGRNQVVRMHLILSNTANVQLKVDPSVVLATRQYVDKAIEAHAKSRNHPDADTKNKGFMRYATLTESRKGKEAKAAQTPAGGMAQIDDHRQEESAHNAGQITLASTLEKFGDAGTVQAVLALLGDAAKSGVGHGSGLDADTLDGMQATDFAGSDAFQNVVVFRVGISKFRVPDVLKKGLRKALITLSSGGGGGGSSSSLSNRGAGGGGSATGFALLDLTGVDEVLVTVGKGGAMAPNSNASGGNGSTSSFGEFCSVEPGRGGDSGSGGGGGAGGNGGTGCYFYAGGGNGGDSNGADGSGGSAEGGTSMLGGPGRSGVGMGVPPTGYGAGAGGGRADNGSYAGADGIIIARF
ncbi:phage tail protein [Kushneria sp. AK178]